MKDLVSIGKLIKPHGIKGEMSARITNNRVDDISDFPYIFCRIDGIFVPFFIEEVRSKTDVTCLIKLDTIDSEPDAKELTGLDFFLPKELLAEDVAEDFAWDDFVDYSVTDEKAGFLGKVKSVDDSTSNVLFCIENDNKEVLIPANEHFITDIDSEEKMIHVSVPEELLRLN